MKDSTELRIQNQFGAFCAKVLKKEARYIQREYARLRNQEKSLDELTASALEQAAVVAYYQNYIRALATRPLKDEYGNEYLCIDEDMRLRLETKLIHSIVTGFTVLPV